MTVAQTAEIAMTGNDRHELHQLEVVISKGLETFAEVGSALMTIRDKRLYKPDFDTFEEYCRTRWDISRFYAYRLISAADILKSLEFAEEKPTVLPESESTIRPLATVPRAKQAQAWNGAVESAGGKQPTAKQVESAAAKHRPAPIIKAPKAILEEAVEQVAEEPRDIAAQRKSGVIPPTSKVVVSYPNGEVDEADELPDEPLAGMDDDDFLRACPCRGSLNDRCKKIFDVDALVYHHTTAARQKFHHATKIERSRAKKALQHNVGRYVSRMNWFLKHKHPKDWVSCAVCATDRGVSTGKMGGEDCSRCKGYGYYAD